MASFYSVVQYVPDSVRDERINVGVVAFNEHIVACRFLENWKRVNTFGKGGAFVRATVASIHKMELDELKQAMAEWSHNVQFTEPAGSLLEPNTLLFEASRRFLVEPEEAPRVFRSRQDAVNLTKRVVKSSLARRLGRAAKSLIDERRAFIGQRDEHYFDNAVINGTPLIAADSVSFEIPWGKDLVRLVHSIEWSVYDIHDKYEELSLAVVALPPKNPDTSDTFELFERTKKNVQALGAQFVEETDLPAWADEKSQYVADYLKKTIGFPR